MEGWAMKVRSVIPMRIAKNRLHRYIGCSSFIRHIIYNPAGHINANNRKNARSSHGFVWLYQAYRLFFKGLVPFAFQYDLQFGILVLVVGLIVLLKPSDAISLLFAAMA